MDISLIVVIILFLLGSFCIGSFPTGWLLCKKIKGIDILEIKSKSTGAANVGRILGTGWSIFTFIVDTAKGAIVVLIAKTIFQNDSVALLLGVVTIFGHCFSIFLKFRGGKGMSTLLGVSIIVMPIPTLLAFGIWLLVAVITKITSLASLSGSICLVVFVYLSDSTYFILCTYILIAIFVFYAHRENIKLLWQGTERKFSEKKAI